MVTKQDVTYAYVLWQQAEHRPYEEFSLDECLRLRREYRRLKNLYDEETNHEV